MSIERLGLTVLLFSTSCILSSQTLAQSKDQVTTPKPSFELRASPSNVAVHRNQPISVKVDLTNVTGQDAFVRLWTWPVPFGPHTDLHCLMLRCRDQVTGKEVQYTWPPPGKSVADAQGKELPEKIPSGKSVHTPFNIRDFCILPPGKYILELQYDTRFTPSWIKPDTRAWHGITNKVTVSLQVLK